MKEIRAYLRPSQVDVVVRALRGAGASGATAVTKVHGVGSGSEPFLLTLTPGDGMRRGGVMAAPGRQRSRIDIGRPAAARFTVEPDSAAPSPVDQEGLRLGF